MLTSGQTVPLAIEKPAAGGRMIARVEGQVVLVADAIPGERVQARVERIGKGVVYAQTLAVEERSADRRDPFPDPLCGGCLYSHIAYPRQLELKAQVIADAFKRIGHLELPAAVNVARSPEQGYRMRARFHVRGHRLGFFRENSHEVCDARTTRQLLPETADTLDQLMAAMRSLGVESVREIELSENVDATERAVFLDSGPPIGEAALARMADTGGLTGLGSAWGAYGSPHVSDSLPLAGGHITLRRHVQAFFQGNRFLLGALASHVAAQLPEGSSVLDLYAGVGLFSIAAAAARRATVVAVEGDLFAADDLQANAAAAGGDDRRRAQRGKSPVLCGDRRPAENRPVARGARQRAAGARTAPDLRVMRRRHARARRAPDRRSRLRDRARRRIRSLPEHAARRDGGRIRTAGLMPAGPSKLGTAASASATLRGTLRTRAETRRCGRNSPGATGRRGRRAQPDLRSPRSRRRARSPPP